MDAATPISVQVLEPFPSEQTGYVENWLTLWKAWDGLSIVWFLEHTVHTFGTSLLSFPIDLWLSLTITCPGSQLAATIL